MKSTSAGYIRSALFSLGFLGVLILVTPVILLLALLRQPYKAYWLIITWAGFCIWWLRVTCNIRYEITGLENIPDEPLIVFSKHQSTWETLFLHVLTKRHQAWVLKRELMWVPFFGWSMASVRPIPIDRGSGRKALKKIVDLGKQYLAEGSWVMIFPEGTRTAVGETKPFAIGGAMLAAASKYPVLPVAHNAGGCWPRKGFLKYSGTIKVVIGKPIDTTDLSAKQINEVTESWMKETMASIEPNKN